MSKLTDLIPEEQVNKLNDAATKRNNRNDHVFVKPDTATIIARACEKYGKEDVELALIVKNNAEIRRFTSKNIIAALNEGEQNPDDKVHVEFLWNKFKVSKKVGNTNISTEYLYTESFFIKAFVKSFEQFSASSTNTLAAFANAHGINIEVTE